MRVDTERGDGVMGEKSGGKQMENEEKKAALHGEMMKVNQLPARSGYAVHRMKFLNKIMQLLSVQDHITSKWYAAHMVATVLTVIFQGHVSFLIFTTTSNFLTTLKSYVREDDAAIILKMAGGLYVLMFCLEWLVLTLAGTSLHMVLAQFYLMEAASNITPHGSSTNSEKSASSSNEVDVELKL